MKRLTWLFAFLCIFSLHAHAVSFETWTSFAGELPVGQELAIRCALEEASVCQSLCGNAQECLRDQSSCVNCAGGDNLLLRILFTKLDWFFISSPTAIPSDQALALLSNSSYMYFDSKSVYNFYKPWADPTIDEMFLSLCPEQTENVYVGVLMNEIQQVEKLDHLVCQTKDKQEFYNLVPLRSLDETTMMSNMLY